MEIREIVNYWMKSASHDREIMEILYKSGKYDWTLFMVHLIIEKALKARWIYDNNELFPPKTHNLEKLARETKYQFSEQDLIWFVQVTDFNLETRYPDYKFEFYRKATKDFTKPHLQKAKDIVQCLQKSMQ